MSKVKILYLEASEADADSIGSLVNIVREVQSGREGSAVFAAGIEPLEPEPIAALPAPKRAYKPRTPKPEAAAPVATTASGAPRQRAANVGATIVAAVAKSKNGVVNFEALAQQLYGKTDEASVTRARRAVYAAATKGKLVSTGPGKYTVAS